MLHLSDFEPEASSGSTPLCCLSVPPVFNPEMTANYEFKTIKKFIHSTMWDLYLFGWKSIFKLGKRSKADLAMQRVMQAMRIVFVEIW